MPIYFLAIWLFSIFLCTNFLNAIPSDTLFDQVDVFLILMTYGAIYQFPAIIIYWVLHRRRTLAITVAIVFAIIGNLFVFFDSHLFDLYGFHINGFVWNLVSTPGGIDSLGSDQTNIMLVLGYMATLVSVHVASLFLSMKLSKIQIPVGKILMIFLIGTLLEKGVYGYSKATLYGPVLERSDAMPLYQPLSMNTFLKKLGVDVKKSSKVKLDQTKGELSYPKQPIDLLKVDKPMNIVMLISESMRWDLLTPEIMPKMSAFSQKAWNFKTHYSGGNGTRQGLFALFYGLPGNNWDIFLRNQRGPVFFDVLKKYNYQYFIYTSAKFTYPELDRTIFNQIPKEKLIENDKGEPWQRDLKNTTDLINDIKTRDHSKPFFGFMFYESTHARYSFPKNSIIRKDYLETLDYAGLSREELAPKIGGMKARYENAAHGIDIQLQRVVSYLEKSGDIDNTLVVIAGDHGEEFMERGRWGHNSGFTDWQVRTPLIVWMPKSSARVVTQRTSHMDIVPTILARLGVKNPVKDYSLGVDLTKPVGNRNIIVSSWSDIGLINDFGKLVIPFKSTTQHHNLAADLNDNPVDGTELTLEMRSILFQTLNDVKYYRK